MTFVVSIPHLTHGSILFFIYMFPTQSSVETEVSLHAPNQSLREELVPAAKVLEMDVVLGFEDEQSQYMIQFPRCISIYEQDIPTICWGWELLGISCS
jgi:hypothetical protein